VDDRCARGSSKQVGLGLASARDALATYVIDEEQGSGASRQP